MILIQGDTLRKDHLDVYGYARPTAPTLRRLAEERALFDNAITQTSWTKAATPSIMTSLYPTTHGVHQIPDRLPASATTIAEVFREAGYATASFASASFTGAFTNLHQGFEELHEVESTVGRAGPPGGTKTSREYVDRLLEWLEDHRDVPSFVYLHFFDPHSPYEPYRPYDTMWADPKGREEYVRTQEALKKVVTSAFLADRGMATRDELVKAGLDPEAFIRFSKDWYDGSIRGMDTELARLVERLQELGLGERSVLAFFADHGEEFHDHGRMWHGQSVYGEMVRVPLILWGPGRVPKGVKIEEPVELVDVMPTLLEMRRPARAAGVRRDRACGRCWRAAGRQRWEAPAGHRREAAHGGQGIPRASESYAIVDGNWKLIHNVARPPERPEFELYDFIRTHSTRRTCRRASRRGRAPGEGAGRLAPDGGGGAAQARQRGHQGNERGALERLRSLGYIR